jgi:hypothetical protein
MPEDDEPVNPIDFYSIYLNTEYSEEPKSDFFCHNKIKIFREIWNDNYQDTNSSSLTGQVNG